MGEELVTQGLDIQVIVTGVVGLITTVTSGWVSWLFAKKKYTVVEVNVEEKSPYITNKENKFIKILK